MSFLYCAYTRIPISTSPTGSFVSLLSSQPCFRHSLQGLKKALVQAQFSSVQEFKVSPMVTSGAPPCTASSASGPCSTIASPNSNIWLPNSPIPPLFGFQLLAPFQAGYQYCLQVCFCLDSPQDQYPVLLPKASKELTYILSVLWFLSIRGRSWWFPGVTRNTSYRHLLPGFLQHPSNLSSYSSPIITVWAILAKMLDHAALLLIYFRGFSTWLAPQSSLQFTL